MDREPKSDVTCIAFGAPLVGDKSLAKLVLDSGWHKRIHQIVWRHDMVPRILLSPGTCAPQLALPGGGQHGDCVRCGKVT